MQALNIKADLSNTALNLQSAPSKNMPDNAVSFASLVSAEIDKSSSPTEKSVSEKEVVAQQTKSDASKESVCESKSASEAKNTEKDISNDVKEVADNAVEKNVAEETLAADEKAEKTILASNSEKTLKKETLSKSKNVASSEKKIAKSEKSQKTVAQEKDVSIDEAILSSQNATLKQEIVAENVAEDGTEATDESSVASVSDALAKKIDNNAQNGEIASSVVDEISEEGEKLIASAMESLESKNESDESGEKDFSSDNRNRSEKTVVAKKGASLTVRDERTTVDDSASQKKVVPEAEIKSVGNNAVEMTMANVTDVNANITSSNSQTAGAVGSNYQSMLANQIQNNAPEFVKAGSIVLRDNNQGTINLILHPESLGNVKVSLQLTDKVIAGQIVVQSQEAYNAFRDSIDSLKQAFAQNGFDTANFNLAMGGDMMNGNGGNPEQRADAPFVASRAYGDYAESVNVSDSPSASYAGATDGVDIVA